VGGFAECGAGTGVVVAPVEWSFEQERPLNGVTLGDCDDDGLPEAVVFNYAAPARLYRNLGGFRFHDVTSGSGIETPNRATNAAFGDLDGDGRLDLVMTEGLDAVVSGAPPPSVLEGAVRVFRGAGACRFTEVTSAWGFEPVRTAGLAFPSGVDLADVDADGRLDVLVRMLPERVSRTILYMSRPDGRWVDATAEVLGPVPGSAWAALCTDTDGDMQPDLFLLLTGGDGGPPARFLRREGPAWPPRFREAIPVSSLFGPEDDGQRKLMGGASGDFDGDGALDIFLTDIGAQHLLRRVGDNAYEDVAFQAGVAASRLPAYFGRNEHENRTG
jgi:hypothetical protein